MLSVVSTWVESAIMINCVGFFPADFGDYNQFESHDFLREYVLFPMVSTLPPLLWSFMNNASMLQRWPC